MLRKIKIIIIIIIILVVVNLIIIIIIVVVVVNIIIIIGLSTAIETTWDCYGDDEYDCYGDDDDNSDDDGDDDDDVDSIAHGRVVLCQFFRAALHTPGRSCAVDGADAAERLQHQNIGANPYDRKRCNYGGPACGPE